MADDLPQIPHFADHTPDSMWEQRLLRSSSKPKQSVPHRDSPNLLQFNAALRHASERVVPQEARPHRLRPRSVWLKALYRGFASRARAV